MKLFIYILSTFVLERMSISIAELRTRLTKLGVDTSTPGLAGEDRREELALRLQLATGAQDVDRTGADGFYQVPSMSNLPMAEIRERLASLGESTATPGLTGEGRRLELMQRLVRAICGSGNDETANDVLDDLISVSSVPVPVSAERAATPEIEEVPPSAEPVEPVVVMVTAAPLVAAPKFKPVPPPPPRKPAPKPEPEPAVVAAMDPPKSAAEQTAPKPIPTSSEISEMKKTLRRISNKRAIYVASKLSGNNQDQELKDGEKLASWADAEVARLRLQKQKSKAPSAEKGSSMLIENGILMLVDKVVAKLEDLRNEAKEQVRIHRLRIRAEADGNPEFGVAVEEHIKAALSEAAINKGLSLGRTRQRIDELNERAERDVAVASMEANNKNSAARGGQGDYDVDDDDGDNDDGDDEGNTTSAFASVGNASRLGPHKKKTLAAGGRKKASQPSAYDSRFAQLSAQGDAQMRGFEELLAELEMEEESSRLQMEMEKEDLHKKHEREAKETVERWDVKPFVKEIKSSNDRRPPPPTSRPPSQPATLAPASRPNSRPGSKGSKMPPATTAGRPLSAAMTDGLVPAVSLLGRPPPPTSSPPKQQLEMPAVLPPINKGPAIDPESNQDSDEEEEVFQRGGRNGIVEKRRAGRPATGGSEDLPFRGEEDDEELMSLLHKYHQKDDENENEEEDEGEGEGDGEDDDEEEPQGVVSRGHGGGARVRVEQQEEEEEEEEEQRVPAQSILKSPPPIQQRATPVVVPSSSPFKPAPRPNLRIDTRRDGEDDEEEEEEEEEDCEEEDKENDENDQESENRKQVKAYRQHARVLEHNGDLVGADQLFARALDLDPLDVRTLEAYGLFLHSRKGELARADAFFTRAVHVCVPDLLLQNEKTGSPGLGGGGGGVGVRETAAPPPSLQPPLAASNLRVKTVVRLLLTYANFLKRSKGDIESASLVYRKAVDIAPDNAKALAECGHFLCEEGGQQNMDDALGLLARALKAAPSNPVYALWYAKLLRRCGRTTQADIMYQVAYKHSLGSGKKIEATAVCNFATFIYRQRKDPDRAQKLFIEGLAKFPWHKGLVKNYGALLKAIPALKDNEEALRASSASTPQNPPTMSKAFKALYASGNGNMGSPKSSFRSSSSGGGGGGNSASVSRTQSPKVKVDALHGALAEPVAAAASGTAFKEKDFSSLFHASDGDDDEGDEEGDEGLYAAPL